MKKLPNYLKLLSGDLRVIGMGQFFRNLMKKNNIGPKVLSERLGTPGRSLMNYLSDSRSIPLTTCKEMIKVITKDFDKSFNQLYKETKLITSTSSKAQAVNLIKTIDHELAYTIGAMHDGCVFSNPKKNQFVVQYIQYSSETWLKKISKILQKNFGITPKYYKKYIQISNKYIFEFFSKVLGIKKQTEWQSFLYGFNWNLQKHMIAGMFDAEGWCSKNDLRLKFSQKNYSKLKELQHFLNRNHIHPGKVVKENDAHALYISGRNCLDFYNKIGIYSKHPLKIERLKSLKRYSTNRRIVSWV
ncbi:MAG: hypothetical protein KKG75_03590 [Nanoarchaeota archaeon]|nr:hypothetical protein [Nanoarchaeota archaeon]